MAKASWGALTEPFGSDLFFWALKTFVPSAFARLFGMPKRFHATAAEQLLLDDRQADLFPIAPRKHGAFFDTYVSTPSVQGFCSCITDHRTPRLGLPKRAFWILLDSQTLQATSFVRIRSPNPGSRTCGCRSTRARPQRTCRGSTTLVDHLLAVCRCNGRFTAVCEVCRTQGQEVVAESLPTGGPRS